MKKLFTLSLSLFLLGSVASAQSNTMVMVEEGTQACLDNGVRLTVIGRRDRLPADLCRAVAAAEAATGLRILVVLFRSMNTINIDELDSLKG